MPINRTVFFSRVRGSLFAGHLTDSQVSGMNAILDTWEASSMSDLRWLAYMLGTALHETGRAMQPIRESGGNAWYTKMYDVEGSRPSLARQMGNVHPGDGAKYCGRGYVQLTWYCNYKKLGDLIGVDLVSDPDKALDPDIAAKIMFEGMTRGESHVGDFTGRSLDQYFNNAMEDWVSARRIINGLDCASAIATYGRLFHNALV